MGRLGPKAVESVLEVRKPEETGKLPGINGVAVKNSVKVHAGFAMPPALVASEKETTRDTGK